MEAFDYLLRGLSYMNKATPEDTRTALQYFYKAIEKDPAYGRAYSFAFWCYRRQVDMRGLVLSEKEQAEAKRLARTGLKLSGQDHVALWQAGTMKSLFERDFEGALALIDQALSINPNSPRPWYASAMARSCMGDTDTAIEHAEHAIRISPRNPARWYSWWCIAAADLQELRFEKAAEAAKLALQLNDDIVLARLILAASSAHLQRLDEAEAAIEQALALEPDLTISRTQKIFPVARYKNLAGFIDGLRSAGLRE